MHFDILVEDQSGMELLNIVVPKIIGNKHTFSVKSYKGIGRIPRSMKNPKDASKRILLENIPKLLRGYGQTYAGYANFSAVLFVVCDLDDKCLKKFRAELLRILDLCNPRPEARFCIAIEEGEAWLLGDLPAIRKAYPDAKDTVLTRYENDSICGTWEMLADALYPGGAAALDRNGYQEVGREKSNWARNISPYMQIEQNQSPSFSYFKKKLQELLH